MKRQITALLAAISLAALTLTTAAPAQANHVGVFTYPDADGLTCLWDDYFNPTGTKLTTGTIARAYDADGQEIGYNCIFDDIPEFVAETDRHWASIQIFGGGDWHLPARATKYASSFGCHAIGFPPATGAFGDYTAMITPGGTAVVKCRHAAGVTPPTPL